MTLLVVTITTVDPLMETRSKTAVKGEEKKEATSPALRLTAVELSQMGEKMEHLGDVINGD
ncbi:predicted protein [Arabidopsis lyrata subsp. lyrata]|uniref:Predicted protein n=1 Tax=Arabidopsis lyrata subsp. lyrata TaxID=81972 RepID=D7LBH6_ARALL|nr:predicted protein [Arabidopsis lyrata subsp. lyrata]